MAFMDFLFGKGERTDQIQKFNPNQQGALNQALQGSQQQMPQMFEFLQKILSQDPDMMQQFQAPAMRQFNEEIIPGIAERFTGLGAQKSNAFGQQLGAAGAGLAENLSAQRGKMGFDASNQLQQLLSTGLTPQFDNLIRPETHGALGNMLSAAGQGAGLMGGAGLGNLGGSGLKWLMKQMGVG